MPKEPKEIHPESSNKNKEERASSDTTNHTNPNPMDTVDQLEDFKLNSADQQELDSLYADFAGKFKEGKVITGVVVSKESQGLLVDIHYKSDGLIPNYEFSDFELKKLAPSDSIEVLLDRLEDEHGSVVLSYQKAKSIKAWDNITAHALSDEPVTGVVTHKVKGGLSVDIGIPAFLPGSQVDIQRVANFDQFVNQEVTCKILKVNRKRGNVIISRRKYLEEQRSEDKKRILDVIKVGEVLQGVIKNITNYGAFVDIGGVDGLLHITDMSWGRINHPSELVHIGDTVSVKVISFDKNTEKISLGMKQLTENPWDDVEKRYPVGAKISGRISSITDYGLFVEIEKGIEGLVHISEISWTERMTNLARHFSVGQVIDVIVVSIDKENRRMSLSIKQLKDDPWKLIADKFKVGDKINGHITNITDFGLFIQLYDGVDGLVHVSDISWTEHISHPSDRYKRGDLVHAVILAIDSASKKISLGIKQLANDPWDTIEEEYPVGKMVTGVVSKITNFGAFIRMPNGVEGLVHISELADHEVHKTEDVLALGQKVEFRVIKVNKEERKLGLSLRSNSSKPRSHQAVGDMHKSGSSQFAHGEGERKQERSAGKASPPRSAQRESSESGARAAVATEKVSSSPLKSSLQQALQDFKAQRTETDTTQNESAAHDTTTATTGDKKSEKTEGSQ